MASLTTVAITTRKIIRYSIYFVIFLIIARLLFSVGKNLYQTLFPTPPPAPTVDFGKLPPLDLPKNEELPALEFKVETAQGDLPTLPDQIKVYFMPRPIQTQLNLDLAREKALSMGFSPDPQKISQTLYKFTHTREPATLEINIITNSFSVSYDLSENSAPVTNIAPPLEIALANARSFLSTADLLGKDLTGETTHQFYSIQAGQLVPVLSRSEASLIKVNLFRNTLDDIPSITLDSNESNVWFMISGSSQRTQQIVAGEYHHFPVDQSVFETYPLKTTQEALQDLASGAGYITNYTQSMGTSITIRNVYLAYLDLGKQSEFYQPTVVFEGDNNFRAIVPAITNEYYGE